MALNLHSLLAAILLLLLSITKVQAAYIVNAVPQTAFDLTTTNVIWANTNTSFPDDDDQLVVPLGFNFSFGGVTYTQVRVITNGMLHFGADQAIHQVFNNAALAVASADRLIIPYWDDLSPLLGGTVTYDTFGTGPNRRFVVTWDSIPVFGAPASSYTFQVVLFETGDILFRYGNDDANGAAATIGIEEDDSDFNQFSFNSVSVSDALDLLWEPSLPSILEVRSICTSTNQISIIFASTVSSGIVDDINNYTLDNGVVINSATLINSTTVQLNTSGFTIGASYTLQSVNPAQTVPFVFGVVTFADTFSIVSYSNNNGSGTWAGDWLENQEAGGGGGPTAGNITITANALRMDDRPNTGGQPNLSREVDLSGYISATLTFDYQTLGNLEGSDRFRVDVSSNGGASYTTVRNYSNDVNGAEIIDLTPFISSNTRIRFLVRSNYGGPGEAMEIDNVQIAAIPGGSLCVSGADHLSIGHDGNGVNCQAENITISAHTDATPVHLIESSYTGTVSLATDTNHGDWSYVSGGNPANLSNLGNGSGSYIFDGSESGSVVLALFNTFAETININASDGTVSETSGIADASDDPLLTYNTAGFQFLADGAASSIGTQIAGKSSNTGYAAQLLELEAINTNSVTGACEAILSGNVSVELAFECENASICQRPIYLGGAAASDQVVGTNNGGALTYTAVLLDFGTNTDTTANLVMNYPDAGQIQLHARYTLMPSGEDLLGSSNSFVSRPFGFVLNAEVNPGPIANPAAIDENGLVFTTAGNPFIVNATSALWNSADDANSDGIPDGHGDSDPSNNDDLSGNTVTLGAFNYTGTPNFGQEGEDLELFALLDQPSGGNDPGLPANTLITAFTAGAGSHSNVFYNEVGIIEIRAEIDSNDYLAIGAIETAKMISKSGYIGRFTPASLSITAVIDGEFLDANTSGALDFTYIGQPFFYTIVHPSFTVSALSTGGGPVTQNYTGVWGKLNAGSLSFTAPTSDTTQVGSDLATLMAITYTADAGGFAAPTDNGNGTYDFVFPNDEFVYDRDANSEIPPFSSDINLIITDVTDLDGITNSGTTNLQPQHPITSDIRFGRIKMSNIHGSELIGLAMPMIVETLDLSGSYSINIDDSSTGVTTADLVITDNLSAPGSSTVSVTNPLAVAGDLGVTLTAPGAGVDGNIVVSPSLTGLVDWLQYDWDSIGVGLFDDDPSALATFGIFTGNDVNIYKLQIYQ